MQQEDNLVFQVSLTTKVKASRMMYVPLENLSLKIKLKYIENNIEMCIFKISYCR